MDRPRNLPALFLFILAAGLSSCATHDTDEHANESADVVMICEHGSAKSLMAASLFNRRAAERNLPMRAIARGVSPDESVPTPIAEALAREGFEVQGFIPTRMSAGERAHASRVIAIGVDPAKLGLGPETPVETWNDVPPASVDYAAAHESLQQHVDALLTELQR